MAGKFYGIFAMSITRWGFYNIFALSITNQGKGIIEIRLLLSTVDYKTIRRSVKISGKIMETRITY